MIGVVLGKVGGIEVAVSAWTTALGIDGRWHHLTDEERDRLIAMLEYARQE